MACKPSCVSIHARFLQDLEPIYIPPGAANTKNSFWDDPGGIILSAVMRHCDIGQNQIVSNCNPRITTAGGCKEMGAQLLKEVTAAGRDMIVLVYHGEGYEILEPGGQYPSRPLPAKNFQIAMKVTSSRPVSSGIYWPCMTKASWGRHT